MTKKEIKEIFRKNKFNRQKVSKELNVELPKVRELFRDMYLGNEEDKI